jgi:hypothetical protein
MRPSVKLYFLRNSLLRSEQAANSRDTKSKLSNLVLLFESKMKNSSLCGDFSPAWRVSHRNREICKKHPTRKFQSLISVKSYRFVGTGRAGSGAIGNKFNLATVARWHTVGTNGSATAPVTKRHSSCCQLPSAAHDKTVSVLRGAIYIAATTCNMS